MTRLLLLLVLVGCGQDDAPATSIGPDRVLEGPLTGLRVDASPDLSGDGAPDVVITSPGLDGNGGVYVFDASLTGTLGRDRAHGGVEALGANDVGEGLASCGDLNGDGIGDLAIGAPAGNNGQGGVWVVHGPVNSTTKTNNHWEIRGTVTNGYGGYSMKCGGDFDGDGLADLVFSSPDGDGFGLGERTGQIFFHRGQDSGTDSVASFSSTFSDAHLGREDGLAFDTDLTGDGLHDTLIGGNGASMAFLLEAPYMGTMDGNSSGIRWRGRDDDDGFGHAVAAGDLNGDGYPDAIVSAPAWGADVGAIGIIDGPFDAYSYGDVDDVGRWIDGIDATEQLGYDLAIATDVDGDGLQDLVASGPGAVTSGEDAGVVYVFFGPAEQTSASTADLVLLGTVPHAEFGLTMALVPDVTGDGLDELLVGAPYADVGDTIGAGQALLFHSPLTDRAEDLDADAIFSF